MPVVAEKKAYAVGEPTGRDSEQAGNLGNIRFAAPDIKPVKENESNRQEQGIFARPRIIVAIHPLRTHPACTVTTRRDRECISRRRKK